MNPAQRKRLLMILAACIVGALIGDRLLLTPQMEAWKRRAMRIDDLNAELEKSVILLNRESDLRDDWRRMEAAALPADQPSAENQVLRAVDQWARQSGISVSSIKPRPVQDDLGWNRLEFRATGKGSLENVARFLWLLGSSPLALRVEETQIAGRETAVNDLTLDIRFSGLMIGPGPTTNADVAERSSPGAERSQS